MAVHQMEQIACFPSKSCMHYQVRSFSLNQCAICVLISFFLLRNVHSQGTTQPRLRDVFDLLDFILQLSWQTGLTRLLPPWVASSILTALPNRNTNEVAKLNFIPPPNETTEHPLPVFEYPEAIPVCFDQEYDIMCLEGPLTHREPRGLQRRK